jgi:hypothetical protein
MLTRDRKPIGVLQMKSSQQRWSWQFGCTMAADFEVKKEIPGKAFVRRASCATAPLGVLAFWGGMLMAARRYPSEYDWRYMTLSSLLSPGRDHAGHLWASGGIRR